VIHRQQGNYNDAVADLKVVLLSSYRGPRIEGVADQGTLGNDVGRRVETVQMTEARA
jgi:hypothetical protein